MKNKSFYIEAKENLEKNLSFLKTNMKSLVANLNSGDKFEKTVDDMYSRFHTLKALTNYLEIKPIYQSIQRIEEVFITLKEKKPPLAEQLEEYLLLLSDEIGIWHQRIAQNEFDKIEPLNAYILNMVKILIISPKKCENILKEQKVAFYIHDKEFFEKNILPLKGKVKEFLQYDDLELLCKSICVEKPGLVIVESHSGSLSNIKHILEITGKHPFTPVVVLKSEPLEDKELDYLTMIGIYYYIDKGDVAEDIEEAMKVVSKAYYEKKGIRLMMSPVLKNKINILKPLPKTLYEIQDIAKDSEKGVNDMVEAVSKDVALTAKILQNINRPIYGLRKTISSIQQAVTLLGKDGSATMAFQAAVYGILNFNLDSYGMGIDDFYEVSYKRLRLASIWYSKIAPNDIDVVSTAALIGNIGELLISQEASERRLSEKFKHIVQTQSPIAAEIEVFHTTTEDVTAAILYHWGLDDKLINAIKYSNDLLECPDDIKKLAFAIYIINQTIPINNKKIPNSTFLEMQALIDEMNLNSKEYKKAAEELELISG